MSLNSIEFVNSPVISSIASSTNELFSNAVFDDSGPLGQRTIIAHKSWKLPHLSSSANAAERLPSPRNEGVDGVGENFKGVQTHFGSLEQFDFLAPSTLRDARTFITTQCHLALELSSPPISTSSSLSSNGFARLRRPRSQK